MKKVSSKEKKSEDTLELMLKVMRESSDRDKKEVAAGNLIKYIFEIRDTKGNIEDVICVYTDLYYNRNEIISKSGFEGTHFTIRGPFPLYDGAMANSKINRWKSETEKSEKDLVLIEKKIALAEKSRYKYIYLFFDDVFGVERFTTFLNANKAIPKYKIEKFLEKGNKRTIKRIALDTGNEKVYEAE